MKYHKLVRDRIIERIKHEGKAVTSHTADDAEYWQKLKEKLREEVDEFIDSEQPEELADILEVIDAIIAHKHVDMTAIQQLKEAKRNERGAFAQKHILDEVTES